MSPYSSKSLTQPNPRGSRAGGFVTPFCVEGHVLSIGGRSQTPMAQPPEAVRGSPFVKPIEKEVKVRSAAALEC